jgi:hypothetical protein
MSQNEDAASRTLAVSPTVALSEARATIDMLENRRLVLAELLARATAENTELRANVDRQAAEISRLTAEIETLRASPIRGEE